MNDLINLSGAEISQQIKQGHCSGDDAYTFFKARAKKAADLNSFVEIYEQGLLASGDSKKFMFMKLTECCLLLIFIIFGGLWGGILGTLIGISISYFVFYPVLVLTTKKYGVWTPKIDFLFLLGSGVVVGLGLWLVHSPK